MDYRWSYLLASLVSGGLAIGWWLGGLEAFLATGLLNVASCTFIALVAVVTFVMAFWRPDVAWLGADLNVRLGLLGTVAGLVFALPNVRSGDTDAIVMGIALALLTTGVGLVGSIVLFVHGWFLGLRGE